MLKIFKWDTQPGIRCRRKQRFEDVMHVMVVAGFH